MTSKLERKGKSIIVASILGWLPWELHRSGHKSSSWWQLTMGIWSDSVLSVGWLSLVSTWNSWADPILCWELSCDPSCNPGCLLDGLVTQLMPHLSQKYPSYKPSMQSLLQSYYLHDGCSLVQSLSKSSIMLRKSSNGKSISKVVADRPSSPFWIK